MRNEQREQTDPATTNTSNGNIMNLDLALDHGRKTETETETSQRDARRTGTSVKE